MRPVLTLLLIGLNSVTLAAEKVPVADFLRDMRSHILSMQQQDHTVPVIVRRMRVEMQVIAEQDESGNLAYYILEGQVGSKDVVTQKLSFDLEFQPRAVAPAGHAGQRSYSTRRREHAERPDRYHPQYSYPYHPDRYVPEISPVILFDRGR